MTKIARTFRSATVRSLAGLRRHRPTHEFRDVVAMHRKAGDRRGQQRKAGAAVNAGGAAPGRDVLIHIVSISWCVSIRNNAQLNASG